MASLVRGRHNKLVLQARWQGKLLRRYLGCEDTRDNRRRYAALVRDVTYEVKSKTLEPAKRFPSRQPAEVAQATLGAYARRWLQGQRKLGDKGRAQYEYLFKRFLDRTPLGAMDPRNVTRQDVSDAIEGAPRRLATMFLQRLRAVLHQLEGDGIVAKNVAAFVDNPHKDMGRNEPVEGLNDAEWIRLINAAEGQDRDAIIVGRATGMRPGEIWTVQYKDVDLKRKRLYVRGTKTRGSKRYVDLNAEALEVFRRLLAEPSIGPVFHGARGKKIRLDNWRKRNWTPLLRRAKLPYRSPLVLRHTFAIALLAIGQSPVYVASQMGHTNTQTIHRDYARWINRVDEQAGGES